MAAKALPSPLWLTASDPLPTSASGLVAAALILPAVFAAPFLAAVPKAAVAPALLMAGINAAMELPRLLQGSLQEGNLREENSTAGESIGTYVHIW